MFVGGDNIAFMRPARRVGHYIHTPRQSRQVKSNLSD